MGLEDGLTYFLWKTGSVVYKVVPELKGVDLSTYRGIGREKVRGSICKHG